MVNQKGGVLPAVAAGCVPCMAAAGSVVPSLSTIFGISAVTGAGVVATKCKKSVKKAGKRKYKNKSKKKGSGDKKKGQKGGSKKLLSKLQIKNGTRLKKCEKTAKNKYQKKKCLDEFHKTWEDYSKFLKKNAIRGGPHYADRKKYTPKQQREIMKRFFSKSKKGGNRRYKTRKKKRSGKYLKK